MKKAVLALTILVFLAFTAGSAQAQGDDAKFKKFQDTFWDAYFKFFPTAGTEQGYTKYNDKLEDLSQAAIEKFLESIDAFNKELVSKMDVTKVSPDVRIEVEMIRDFLDLQVLKLENSLYLVDNPLYYNDLVVNSIRSLIVRNPASPAAASRAKLLPGLIKKAKENLKNPPQEYTQAAIKQLPAVIDFYRTEVPKIAGAAPGLAAETVKIIAALEDFQRFLQGELLARSTGNFRTGEAHLKTLRYLSQGNLPILESIVAQSKADYNNIRREMFLVCIPFFKVMYPNVDSEQMGKTKGEEQTRVTIIQGVLDKIKTDHVGRDEFVGRLIQAATNVKNYLQQTKLLDLPEENLQIEPMPAYMAGGLWTHLSAPGAFEPSGAYTLYVQPIPADWSADQTTSFLEEHNNYYVDFMTIQRNYPGVFVPLYFTRKDPSVMKRIAPNQALLKGWSMYLEEMLVQAGYGNFDLRMRLNQLKLLLKTVIDFQMDINVHEGTFTKEKVMEYMMRGGFMSQAEAERRWNMIVLNPGEAALTYIGYQEILDLEKEYRKLKGNAFNAKEYLQKLLSYGAVPFRTLKANLTQ